MQVQTRTSSTSEIGSHGIKDNPELKMGLNFWLSAEITGVHLHIQISVVLGWDPGLCAH